ncbi:hypothetical protein FS842_009757 [Serendipita sp. 407]|nr:hypothetical protein FRC18_007055 [Serendipita sp. 400]KAG9056738.1 hypothetical protein FS842_009757 [Serendipita sp. 407]
MLNLPGLWRAVEIDLASGESAEARLDRLERRLNLAKGITVDVMLVNTRHCRGLTRDQYRHLFQVLVKLAPVERWYSLWIEERIRCYLNEVTADVLQDVFVGTFSSLRILSIHGYGDPNYLPRYCSDLFHRITRSKPQLQHLYLMTLALPPELPVTQLWGIPSIGAYLRLLGNESYDLSLSSEFITYGHSVPWYKGEVFPVRLPKSVTIRYCTWFGLPYFDATRVVVLRIQGVADWGTDVVFMHLPNLQTLDIRPCIPHYLKAFKAPKIEQVVLLEAHQYNELPSFRLSRRESRSKTISLFESNRNSLELYPTSLTIDLNQVADGALVAMLKAWPQLKHLSMKTGDNFDPLGMFARKLLSKSPLLSPQLETIYLETWWYARGRKWKEWRKVAKELIETRREGSLESITWRNSWFDVETVERDFRDHKHGVPL